MYQGSMYVACVKDVIICLASICFDDVFGVVRREPWKYVIEWSNGTKTPAYGLAAQKKWDGFREYIAPLIKTMANLETLTKSSNADTVKSYFDFVRDEYYGIYKRFLPIFDAVNKGIPNQEQVCNIPRLVTTYSIYYNI
jgi:hypothetical protein